MTLEPNKTYFINFVPSSINSSELKYRGYGSYTGKSMTDNNGNKLFWFTKLADKKGFTNKGWFSADDIEPSE